MSSEFRGQFVVIRVIITNSKIRVIRDQKKCIIERSEYSR